MNRIKIAADLIKRYIGCEGNSLYIARLEKSDVNKEEQIFICKSTIGDLNGVIIAKNKRLGEYADKEIGDKDLINYMQEEIAEMSNTLQTLKKELLDRGETIHEDEQEILLLKTTIMNNIDESSELKSVISNTKKQNAVLANEIGKLQKEVSEYKKSFLSYSKELQLNTIEKCELADKLSGLYCIKSQLSFEKEEHAETRYFYKLTTLSLLAIIFICGFGIVGIM